MSQDDYDSPWKTALEGYFPEFMAFFFPEAYANIRWEAGHEFLDQELAQVVRDAELGRRYADKLVPFNALRRKQRCGTLPALSGLPRKMGIMRASRMDSGRANRRCSRYRSLTNSAPSRTG